MFRKAEEVIITAIHETTLSKQRILELYLNSAEWGMVFTGLKLQPNIFSKQQLQCLRLGRPRALPPFCRTHLIMMLTVPTGCMKNQKLFSSGYQR